MSSSVSFYVCLVVACFRLAATSDGEKRLYQNLFAGYNKEVRPRHDPTHTIEIDVEFDLNHLVHIDEHSESLQVIAIIDAEWDDDYLVWDPQSYDGVKQLVLSPTKIWVPDIGIQNSADSFFPENYFELFRLHVSYTGRVRWWFGGLMETSCDVDGTLFPFDSLTCSVVVQSWSYSQAFVRLRNASKAIHLDGFNDDAIWHLVATKAGRSEVTFDLEPNVRYSRVEFVMHLDRKPLYYVINIMIPCSFLVFISLMVFWLPPDSDDKVSLSITVLLAFSVFQFVVADLTPVSSDTTPIIGVFVMVAIGLSTLSVVMSILIVRFRGISKPLPRWTRQSAFRALSRLVGAPLPSLVSVQPTSETFEGSDVEVETLATAKMTSGESADKLDSILCELRKITGHQRKNEEKSEMADNWITLATIIDRLFFWISLTILIVTAIWMIVKSTDHPYIDGAVLAVY